MKRVVVVDDEAAIGPVIRSILAPDGIVVEVTADGQAALPRLLDETPDLVILDVNMPGMSGWELCAILRRQSATRALPILFVTGRQQVKDRITAMQFGASDYLTKPFAADDLRRRVRSLLATGNAPEGG